MKTEKNQAPRLTELSEDEARGVTGGTSNIYYDASTGSYILRPAGSVYVGPGILVGHT
jgi:hypothetical protein